MSSICSIECSWLLRRSRSCFQSKIPFLIRKCIRLFVSAYISPQVKHKFVKDRNKPASVSYFAIVVLATNKTCGTYPSQVYVFRVVEHHVLKMTFHHNFKKNLFYISTNITAFSRYIGWLKGPETDIVASSDSVSHLIQGSSTFFALRTGLKLKFFRGPAFKKPRMFSNEYLLQLVYIITNLIQ